MNLRFLPEDKQESDLFFLSLEPNLKSIEQHEKRNPSVICNSSIGLSVLIRPKRTATMTDEEMYLDAMHHNITTEKISVM